ncbi:hypothetical protein BU15DRAFT_61694 [Melanogaster broomeanus]|nr:hypothetical protein BU15DRAFT_61694 [Melanogaster broomeanus]
MYVSSSLCDVTYPFDAYDPIVSHRGGPVVRSMAHDPHLDFARQVIHSVAFALHPLGTLCAVACTSWDAESLWSLFRPGYPSRFSIRQRTSPTHLTSEELMNLMDSQNCDLGVDRGVVFAPSSYTPTASHIGRLVVRPVAHDLHPSTVVTDAIPTIPIIRSVAVALYPLCILCALICISGTVRGIFDCYAIATILGSLDWTMSFFKSRKPPSPSGQSASVEEWRRQHAGTQWKRVVGIYCNVSWTLPLQVGLVESKLKDCSLRDTALNSARGVASPHVKPSTDYGSWSYPLPAADCIRISTGRPCSTHFCAQSCIHLVYSIPLPFDSLLYCSVLCASCDIHSLRSPKDIKLSLMAFSPFSIIHSVLHYIYPLRSLATMLLGLSYGRRADSTTQEFMHLMDRKDHG